LVTNAPGHRFPISLPKSTSCKSTHINPPIRRLVHRWVESIGLESTLYGTHSLRRTKAAQIYRKTGNLRAVQLLLGHTKLESTVQYLGIEVDDALNMAEQIDL
jgi:integrase